MKVFFVVLARGDVGLKEKILELEGLGYPYLVVCGKRSSFPNTVFREPKGKFDAINYGMRFVPGDVDVVVFNDVDTRIHGFEAALDMLKRDSRDLVYARVEVGSGVQSGFYSFLDRLRKRVPIAASGELMLVKNDFLRKIVPLTSCKAEDSYIMFRVLQEGGSVALCEDCYVTTKRTSMAGQEEVYKRRTVGGIYQALGLSRPPVLVRLFYLFLPLISPLLLLSGRSGYYQARGILQGFTDYLRGDRTGSWKPINDEN